MSKEAKRGSSLPAAGSGGGAAGDADWDLIQEFLGGNDSSFNRLVLKYQNKIYNLCYRMLGDRTEAEDVAQEVFVTLFHSVKNFRGDSLFSTWVFRITVNHCKNRMKYLTRRSYFRTQSLDQPLATEEGEVTPEMEDEQETPEQSLLSRETQELIQSKIDELEEEHKTAVILRDIQGLSYEEIAKILHLKEGTVKSRIHRARLELKAKLERAGKL